MFNNTSKPFFKEYKIAKEIWAVKCKGCQSWEWDIVEGLGLHSGVIIV